MGDLGRIGDELGTELARFGPSAGIGAIVAAWPAAVGEAIARNAWPERVARDGVLHVATTGAAWAFELSQLADEILEKLRTALGKEAPAKLRFAPGKVPAPGADLAALAPKPRVEPTPAEAERAGEWAAAIDDPDLREIVARAARASLARGRGDRPL